MSYSSSPKNKFWLPSQGIHRSVITEQLPYYLGPEATVRPYTRKGSDGFLITTPGPCLSDEQINDICEKSGERWEREAMERGTLAQNAKRPYHQPVIVAAASETTQHRR
ncbi:unnamed protein product [Discula destructiva]